MLHLCNWVAIPLWLSPFLKWKPPSIKHKLKWKGIKLGPVSKCLYWRVQYNSTQTICVACDSCKCYHVPEQHTFSTGNPIPFGLFASDWICSSKKPRKRASYIYLFVYIFWPWSNEARHMGDYVVCVPIHRHEKEYKGKCSKKMGSYYVPFVWQKRRDETHLEG